MSFKYHIALNFVLKKLFWGHKVVQQDYRISEAQKNYKNQGKIFCALPQKKYRMHFSYQTVVLTSPLMDIHYHIKDARPHEFFLSKSCINITIDGPTLPHKDACSTTHAFFLSNSCLDITINGPALFKYSMLFKGDTYLKSKDWNFC